MPVVRVVPDYQGDLNTSRPERSLYGLLYTVVLLAATLLPFVYGMSGLIYLVAALILGALFIAYAFRLWRHYSDALARRTFVFSIAHLSLLFAALLIDHYLWPWLA